MAMKSATSKVLASCFAVLAVSAIAATITMGVVWDRMKPINPTRRPVITSTVPPIPTLRLPKTLVPDTYTLVLQPLLYTKIVEEVNVTSPNQTLLFTGNSEVRFQCVKNTPVIYLHSKDLKIHSSRVMNNGTKIPISSCKVHEDESEFLEIQLGESLKAGRNYSLFLNFSGAISDTLEALFVSTYVEQDTNEERFLAATQLEPTYARRLFPCFDEPDMKAVFHLTIIHRRNTEALSNTKMADSNIIDEEWQETTFLPTRKMSTYLLAFVVSQVDELTHGPQPEHRVDIRTYARREAIEAGHTKYADNITERILTFYEEYFGDKIEYKLNKLYQVALPDLSVSAMENWGLITYQEGILLHEEGVSSWMHKEDMAVVIAHELAHQWFGNLVTMKWWSDIWLNEGFATYMSYLAVDNVNTSFQTRHTAIMDDLHAAFESDALISSHPLSMPPEEVQTTSQIIGTFDHISYAKGALVLRMLADVVTEDVFNKGIRRYLETFQGGNTDTDDLWDSIQEVRRDSYITDTRTLMKKWTNQTGYPVITINTTDGSVSQKRFLYNVSAQSSNSWYVPIKFMSNKSVPGDPVWLDVKGPVRKEVFKSKEWILANVNCTGYYRVNYNPENWQLLLHQLETNPNRIPLMNRGQLIDDAFNLARAKLVNVTLALNSTRFLKKERDLLPWQSAVRNLDYFIQMFERSEVYGPMQVYLREQVKDLYGFFRNLTDSSEVPDDHHPLLKHLQITAVEVACSNGLPECIKMAEEKFADWMNSNSSTNNIHPNLRSVIYCQAVAAGGKKEWEFAWEKYQNTTDTSEKDQLRQALSCTKKTWLLNRYLGYTLDPEKIRLMDVAATVIYVAENAAGQALAWNFIRANWDYVSQGDGAVLIGEVSSKFNTQFELEELERFVEDYKLDEAHRALQSIEQTRVNIQWVEENHDVVLQWFERETAHLE